jgi:uncharacterized HAD superfamily protein
MRLGIDIDGTITTAYYWLDFFNKHFGTSLIPQDVLHYEHHIDLGISLEAFKQFRNENLVAIHRLAEPRDGAVNLVNRLQEDGHETYLITAREKSLRLLTQSWLKEEAIRYSKLFHLGSTEKVELAKRLGVELFLEDRYETALAMATSGIPTLLFNTHYNQAKEHPLIVRVDDWDEAYAFIDKLERTVWGAL